MEGYIMWLVMLVGGFGLWRLLNSRRAPYKKSISQLRSEAKWRLKAQESKRKRIENDKRRREELQQLRERLAREKEERERQKEEEKRAASGK